MKTLLTKQVNLLNPIIASADYFTININYSKKVIWAQIELIIDTFIASSKTKDNKKWLYAFEILNATPTYIEHIAQEYSAVATIKPSSRSYSFLAKDYQTRLDTSYLYVGKVNRISIKRRIKEHLGFGHKDTGALNIDYWYAKIKPTLRLRLHLLSLPTTTTSYQVTALEALLANKLNPLIGKRQ